jgi:hypothetical protein
MPAVVRAGSAAVVALVAAVTLAAGQRPDSTVRFVEVSSEAGLTFRHTNGASPEKHLAETMGAGGVLFDVDDDGWLDVFLVDSGAIADGIDASPRHRLFRNRGDGTFVDVTAASGLRGTGYGMGACAADYDNDGAVDLYVTNAGANTLYRGDGAGAFTDVTSTARVGSTAFGASCVFVDIDRDGDVDLYVTNYVDTDAAHHVFCGDVTGRMRAYCHPLNFTPQTDTLYRNDGGGVFTDVTGAAGVLEGAGNGLGAVATDYDADAWPDLFVANDSVPDFLYRNAGDGRLEEVGLLAGVSVASDGRPRAGMGTDAGDYDGDGLLDLFVTNFELQTHTLFQNLGDGLFVDATFEAGLRRATRPFVGFGTDFLDVDNDGDLDLAIANGHVLDVPDAAYPNAVYAQRNLLLRNDGGTFADVTPAAGAGFALVKVSRALLSGDLDNDGDLDLLVTNNGQTADLLRNDGEHAGRAVLVRLVGTVSNRDAIGARLELTAGGRRQVREVRAGSGYLGQSDVRVHFGLGDAAAVERLEVRWPAGGSDVLLDVPVDHVLTVVEGEGLVQRQPLAGRAPPR